MHIIHPEDRTQFLERLKSLTRKEPRTIAEMAKALSRSRGWVERRVNALGKALKRFEAERVPGEPGRPAHRFQVRK